MPDPDIGFTPLPMNIVYLWISASLDTRFKSENNAIEFFDNGVNFENLSNGKILKFDDDSYEWTTLETVFIAAENCVRADVSDIAGNYVLYTNHSVIPVADFTVNSEVGDAPFLIQCTDLSENSPTVWSWDFGDGQLSCQQSPSHIYEVPGTYDLVLTVSNSAGSDTAATVITTNGCGNDRVLVNEIAGFQYVMDAYASLSDGDTIQLQSVTFHENLIFDKDLNIVFTGGYNCGYTNCIGSTIINGNVMLAQGCLYVSGLEIR